MGRFARGQLFKEGIYQLICNSNPIQEMVVCFIFENRLDNLSIYLPLYLPICLSIYLYLYVSISLYLYNSMSLCLYVSMSLCLYASISLPSLNSEVKQYHLFDLGIYFHCANERGEHVVKRELYLNRKRAGNAHHTQLTCCRYLLCRRCRGKDCKSPNSFQEEPP